MLLLLDWFLFALHCAVVAGLLTLWAVPRARRAHLVLTGGTLASWLGLGYFHGWGYCFLTDWHWQVKWRLGERDLPSSFLVYAVDDVCGFDVSPGLVDAVAVTTLGATTVLSLVVNFALPRIQRRS